MVSLLKCCGVFITVIAIFVGLLISGVLRQAGLFKLINPSLPDMLTGMVPALMDGIEWSYTFDDVAKADLTGQIALVTGANAGIGRSLSAHLAKQGATVYMACRNDAKCARASAAIVGNTKTLTLDTSSLASVRACAAEFKSKAGEDAALDMMFQNAGTANGKANDDGSLKQTEDGIENVFQTNHVGHHLLFKLLRSHIEAAPTARIVLTSSASHYDSYAYGVATTLEQLNGAKASDGVMMPYGQSKLVQVLWAAELTQQLGADSSIFVNSFHPGAVATEIWGKNEVIPSGVRSVIENYKNGMMWSCDEGALTGLFLGIHVGVVDRSIRGKYYHPQSQEVTPSEQARDAKLQKAAWKFVDGLVLEK
jgi:NAD(P)-dependent dehydrogenase (short-subunit alcohol dehydrogenase family)|tara:strand:+ start:671 stop:1768 length:1098 start_codon:yes stop_codon:yes gene_type:complete